MVDLAAASELKYVRDVVEALDLWDSMPTSYDWVYDSAESLAGRCDDESLLFHEWMIATARDAIAYSHMQLWKVYDLTAATVDLLNQESVIAAAASARSAIESAVSLTSIAGRYSDTIRRCADKPKEASDALTQYSEALYDLIWGRRSSPKTFEARNVAGHFKFLVKRVTDPDTANHLDQVYAQLCDVVHPSATGHQLYWADPIEVAPEGQQLVALHYGKPNALGVGVSELCLWAVGWSTAWGIRSFRAAIHDATVTLESRL